ncbi:hypothetical protein ACFSUJ_30495 [Streptomyces lusitanus]|uniref:YtkA-like domain-containing protein n=1 Tax=Streptomyces lusitanus TaxID=68232 RepID=A0ABU3JNT0_9ACTN|nr:hypothetical protein [Streptomyces lusitanus]
MALLTVSLTLLTVGFLPGLLSSWTDDSLSLTGGTSDDEITLTVDRPRIGATDVGIRLTPRRGARNGPLPDVTLQAVLPTAGHATPEASAHARGDGAYSTTVHLMTPGRWTFRVSVEHGGRTDEFDFPVAISG